MWTPEKKALGIRHWASVPNQYVHGRVYHKVWHLQGKWVNNLL
jgi:hypothetical protein